MVWTERCGPSSGYTRGTKARVERFLSSPYGLCIVPQEDSTMPTTVLLIRHPESAWNRNGIYQGQMDTPLSALGRIQAELVAARISREHITGIVCSPLRRAAVLAQAIARYHHLSPQA